jgi:hypothetical protein
MENEETKEKRNLFVLILIVVASIISLTISALIVIKTFVKQSPPESSPSPQSIPIETPAPPENIMPCGGFAGKKCPGGYVCQIPATYPDAQGTCVKDKAYTCPSGEWVDCMPGPNVGVRWECTEEYLTWAKENCPNFKGAAL